MVLKRKGLGPARDAVPGQAPPDAFHEDWLERGREEGVMELKLTAAEQEFLSNILERCHHELLNEIVHTDHREFKQGLLKDEKLLDSLVCRLRETAVQELRG
jgi:hypothetical protein